MNFQEKLSKLGGGDEITVPHDPPGEPDDPDGD